MILCNNSLTYYFAGYISYDRSFSGPCDLDNTIHMVNKQNVDRIILYIYQARQALPSELNELQEKIHILSEHQGVRKPSLYITKLALPGSFIIGKNIDNTMLIFPGRLSSI